MTTAWARRRKARFKPDTRPDWRDPDMPAMVWAAAWSDGKTGWRELTSTEAQAIARLRLDDPRDKV
jgi:hypothetical protein